MGRSQSGSDSSDDKVVSLLGALAVLLPFGQALARAAASAQWRSDLPTVRDHALAAVELGGGVTTVLTQGLGVLPLGPALFRATLVSAIATALASWVLWHIVRRLVSVLPLSPRLVALLAAIATLTAGMTEAWQAEATIAGGGAVATALTLGTLLLALQATGPDARVLTPEAARRWLFVAVGLGATFAESPATGVVLLVAVVAAAETAGKRPVLRLWPSLVVALLASFALLTAPLWLRPYAPGSLSDLARAVSATRLSAMAVARDESASLFAWVAAIGIVTLALSAVGLMRALFSERRSLVAALVVCALADLAYPAAMASGLTAAPLAPLRMLAIGAIAGLAAVGVGWLLATISRLRIPMGRAASVLTVVFYLTLAAVAGEQAAYSSDRSEHHAAEEWTDEALEALPTDAAVLVHSPSLAWRLWSAQLNHGQRPDVLVIPAPLLERGSVSANLIPSEPSVTQLLREFALHGQAGELGLSMVADQRPLYVELDPAWEERLIKHLNVDGAWLRFEPHALGRSDRDASQHVLVASERLAMRYDAGELVDPPTRDVMARTLKEHVTAMSLVGMSADTPALIDGVERLDPDDPFVVAARLRLAHAERRHRTRHSLELRDLLRFQ